MPKITLGITGLPEILSRDCGIENPIGDPPVGDGKKKIEKGKTFAWPFLLFLPLPSLGFSQ